MKAIVKEGKRLKILHISDLHLGKRVFEYSMIQEQKYMLSQVLQMAQSADLTLIAGDIYDRQVPPAEAVRLFDDFLTDMRAQGSPVALIAGNHDSAERVAFGAQLFKESGVYLSRVYDGTIQKLTFEDEYGTVCVYLLPFVKPAHVRAATGRPEIEGYTAAVEAAIEGMHIDLSVRNVLVAHQFVTGAVRSESEEIAVGGLDGVDASVFSAFDYVALGHLHAAQSLMDGRVRYSGAPLCYAFSEAGRHKGALLVDLKEKGHMEVQQLPFVPLHAFRKVRGRFEEILNLDNACEDYVQVTLTDEDDVPDAAAKLTAIYPRLAQVLYDNARTRAAQADFSVGSSQNKEPIELFEELYQMQNGETLSKEQRALVMGMMEKIWEEDA